MGREGGIVGKDDAHGVLLRSIASRIRQTEKRCCKECGIAERCPLTVDHGDYSPGRLHIYIMTGAMLSSHCALSRFVRKSRTSRTLAAASRECERHAAVWPEVAFPKGRSPDALAEKATMILSMTAPP